MEIPNSPDTPQQRLRFLVVAGILLAIIGALYFAYLEFWKLPSPMHTQDLPRDYKVTITEAFGLFDGEGHRLVTLEKGAAKSEPMKFYIDEWPLACRFFAAASHPDSLTMVQLGPIMDPDHPGFWLDAHLLTRLDFEDLGMDVTAIEQVVVE